jgi:glycosyltransferase involved in cell wall biosynthesis
MPDDINVRTHVVPFRSTGIRRRVVDVLTTATRRGDVVHVTGDIHFVTLGLRRRRAVLTVLDCTMMRTPRKLPRVAYSWFWLKLPARRAARIVAISSFTADQFAALSGIERSRVDVVPVVVPDSFVPLPPAARGERPVVMCFGKTPNKNLDGVLGAVEGMDLHLIVIGALEPEMQDRLERTGVQFTNAVAASDADIVRFYREADVVLFPSVYEGFGMPIIEANALGRAVVTSDRAPMNEVAGGAACLVDPDDPKSIREGLERVLNDEGYRDELIQAGLRNRERFRPEVAARQYAQIYREMAADRS